MVYRWYTRTEEAHVIEVEAPEASTRETLVLIPPSQGDMICGNEKVANPTGEKAHTPNTEAKPTTRCATRDPSGHIGVQPGPGAHARPGPRANQTATTLHITKGGPVVGMDLSLYVKPSNLYLGRPMPTADPSNPCMPQTLTHQTQIPWAPVAGRGTQTHLQLPHNPLHSLTP